MSNTPMDPYAAEIMSAVDATVAAARAELATILAERDAAVSMGTQLMANYLGPWRICAVCRFATSEHLQPEGWDWRSDEVVTISDGGINDNDHLVRSRSEQDYEHDRRA